MTTHRYRVFEFEREGTCNKCGKCCRELMPNCEHLTEEGLCAVHDDKPEECKEYPIHPFQLVDGCGFTFNKITKWQEVEID